MSATSRPGDGTRRQAAERERLAHAYFRARQLRTDSVVSCLPPSNPSHANERQAAVKCFKIGQETLALAALKLRETAIWKLVTCGQGLAARRVGATRAMRRRLSGGGR
jgi:hypothetical protein